MNRIKIVILSVLFLFSYSTVSLGTPIQGPEVGTIDSLPYGKQLIDWHGTYRYTTFSRDNMPPSGTDGGYYWEQNGLRMEGDSSWLGDFVDNGDGTATQEYTLFKVNGTFTIYGDHLWGHDPGTVYSASVQHVSKGTNFYEWDDTNGWVSYKVEAELHWWGDFIENPQYSLSLTANSDLGPGFRHPELGWARRGDMYNVVIEITRAPVPEPATMLLFGTGLAGLAGYRRRQAKKK